MVGWLPSKENSECQLVIPNSETHLDSQLASERCHLGTTNSQVHIHLYCTTLSYWNIPMLVALSDDMVPLNPPSFSHHVPYEKCWKCWPTIIFPSFSHHFPIIFPSCSPMALGGSPSDKATQLSHQHPRLWTARLQRNLGEEKKPWGLWIWICWPTFSSDVGGITLWWTYKKQWKDPPFFMGKSTISMLIFNSKLLVITRGIFRDVQRFSECWSMLKPCFFSHLVGGRSSLILYHGDVNLYQQDSEHILTTFIIKNP